MPAELGNARRASTATRGWAAPAGHLVRVWVRVGVGVGVRVGVGVGVRVTVRVTVTVTVTVRG